MRSGRNIERQVGKLKVPTALKFVTISFSISWLFSIIEETRVVWVLFVVVSHIQLFCNPMGFVCCCKSYPALLRPHGL